MAISPNEQRALEAVLHRATTDFDFRQQLLLTPRQAIQDAYGVCIPSTFRVKFVERDSDVDALIVLPDFRRNGDELSDEELDDVAGGDGGPGDPGWADGITKP